MTTEREQIMLKQQIENNYFNYYLDLKQDQNIKIKSEFTIELESPYDVKMRSGACYYIMEIKIRADQNSSFFNKYGNFLEEKKHLGMIAQQNKILEETGVQVKRLYFNFTQDKLIIYELRDNYNFFEWLLPKNNIDKRVKVLKSVTRLYNPLEIIDLNMNEELYLRLNSTND